MMSGKDCSERNVLSRQQLRRAVLFLIVSFQRTADNIRYLLAQTLKRTYLFSNRRATYSVMRTMTIMTTVTDLWVVHAE